MSVRPDHWIRQMAQEKGMIEPFVDGFKRDDVISYGVSSYGYDARVADEFKIFTNVDSAIVDPKDFSDDGFEWISCENAGSSVISYMRKGREPGDELIIICNFTPIPREGHIIGVPQGGNYHEIFNSDSEYYGGSNIGNHGRTIASEEPADGRPWRLSVKLPPLGAIVLKRGG